MKQSAVSNYVASIILLVLVVLQTISLIGVKHDHELHQEQVQQALSELRVSLDNLEKRIKNASLQVDTTQLIAPNESKINTRISETNASSLSNKSLTSTFNPDFDTLSESEILEWYTAFSKGYEDQMSFSDNDREMIPLVQLSEKNPELLLELFLQNPTDTYVEMALYNAITSENYYLIEDYISTNPMLMQIAINAGMHHEKPSTFDSLLDQQLKSDQELISDALIEVSASSLKGTEAEDKLRKYAVEGQNRYLTFMSLERAGYDNIEALANDIWKSTSSNPLVVGEWDEIMISYSAARYGNRDALNKFVYFYKTSSEMVEFERLFNSLFKSVVTVDDYEQNRSLFSYDKEIKKWSST